MLVLFGVPLGHAASLPSMLLVVLGAVNNRHSCSGPVVSALGLIMPLSAFDVGHMLTNAGWLKVVVVSLIALSITGGAAGLMCTQSPSISMVLTYHLPLTVVQLCT